ncbi:hypothetical protein LZ578_03860 [Jeotgalibaca sp. MA1X17-3]|uniref:hypothetical protein n=1 Tax=Jeotgalibaca sp. MA1X17-3 TaxID=2908211 RepID=UPI001F473083|nr:hypothetical protein [Jeotgalibaca sp. MA1X17-3]UJF16274.1 hypothetical protein LZ578_03860 [Jeotgalibaca sp. MA1X17-3]
MVISYKKCLNCGSPDVEKIIYSSPSVGALKEQEDSPQYHCNTCGQKWTAKEALDAAYNEIIGLRTSAGGFFGGYCEVTVDFQDRTLVWKHSLENELIEKQLSQSNLSLFISDLKMVDLLNWKRRYDDPDVLDGTQWEVEIIYKKCNKRKNGSNMFPAEWDDFCTSIRTISGKKFQ